MRTFIQTMTTIGTFFLLTITASAQGTYSGKAINESLNASSHASRSVAYSVAAGSQVAAGIIAVPFIVVGESGSIAADIGDELWDAATQGAPEPLEISDTIVTVDPPPNEAVNQ